VAYLGDDNTDEAAFLALQGRGVSILVRPTWRETAAKYWLQPPDELLDFLGLWLKTCVQHSVKERSVAKVVNR